MVHYRRNRVSGETYFFTVTLRDRRATFLVDYIDMLRAAFREELRKRPFIIDPMVVLPEHLHAVWTLPPGDADYPERWRSIKSRFTRLLVKSGANLKRHAKGEYDLWQQRYWEHTIRDEEDLTRHVDYIHFNPVKHGWVKRVRDWPHSSFHRLVRQRVCSRDWAGVGADADEEGYGE